MNTKEPHTNRHSLRTVLVLAAAFMVLLASCATKSSIRNLTGLPVQSEQGVGANHRAMVATFDVCSYSLISEIETTTQSTSIDLKQLGPALLVAVGFLFFFGYVPSRQPSHPYYGSKKIAGTLPLYLQYQHLRIFS